VTAYGCRVTSEVRQVTGAEMGDYLGCIRTGFLSDREVTVEEAEWKASRTDLSRTFCAFADGKLCGTSSTFPTDLTVPGGTVAVCAITEVTVLPTHRRQGHLTGMMKAMLDDAVERGEPVAILTASEWPIYGRFGFGPASDRVSMELNTSEVKFTLPPSGSMEIVGVHELRALAPDLYERTRLSTVGALSRDAKWWDALLNVEFNPASPPPKARVRAVWRDGDGYAQGYVIYDTTEFWSDGLPRGEIHLRQLVAATPEAHRELWRFMSEVDLVGTIRAAHRPVDEPLSYYLVDGRSVRVRARADHLWVRLLDVRASLSARTYSMPGQLVFEVGAPSYQASRGPGSSSRFVVEGDPGGGACEPTDKEPDLVMDMDALGAVYLGGTSFASLAAAGSVREVVPGSVARADVMFAVKPLPYLTTNF